MKIMYKVYKDSAEIKSQDKFHFLLCSACQCIAAATCYANTSLGMSRRLLIAAISWNTIRQ